VKILAIEKELASKTGTTDKALFEREARRAWELTQSGIFREMYFMRDRPLAIIVLEADTIEAAKKALDSLPLVREKIIDFDIIPLVPYPGFARLFKDP
jgi:hypothetical protein